MANGFEQRVHRRLLVLGGTVVALVLVETLYLGRQPAPAPADQRATRSINTNFTFSRTHSQAPKYVAPRGRAVVG